MTCNNIQPPCIPACILPDDPNTTGTTMVRHCHMRLTSFRKSLHFVNFSACFLAMSTPAGQLTSIIRQVFVFLFLKQMSGRLAAIFLAIGIQERRIHSQVGGRGIHNIRVHTFSTTILFLTKIEVAFNVRGSRSP